MPLHLRPRRLVQPALTVALVALIAACAQTHPDTIFHNHTDFNREVGSLFSILIWLGTAVFVFVEAILIYALIRFRHREDAPEPQHLHGNSTLEILWTTIPAVILIIIAVPTVRTIFRTEAPAAPGSLQVEVIGHQWWWEFRYPQYGITTANEVYLPIGRTVNFTLKSQDVIHSFWAPSMGGKRDVVTNRTNYLWYTPDSVSEGAWNGACAEYCGTSHANMRFKVFTVTPEHFASWVANQQKPAAFGVPAAGQVPTTTAEAVQKNPNLAQPVAPTPSRIAPDKNLAAGARTTGAGPTIPAAGATTGAAAQQPATAVAQAGFVAFPRSELPKYAVPETPTPPGLAFDTTLKGDPARGAAILAKGVPGGCLGCHTIKGVPTMVGQVGPNLTHVGSRTTIAGGVFPNDTRHLSLWIKNAREMKPGILMPTLGQGQYDPILKARMTAGLSDQQIADIVAYLQALK